MYSCDRCLHGNFSFPASCIYSSYDLMNQTCCTRRCVPRAVSSRVAVRCYSLERTCELLWPTMPILAFRSLRFLSAVVCSTGFVTACLEIPFNFMLNGVSTGAVIPSQKLVSDAMTKDPWRDLGPLRLELRSLS